MKKLVLSIMAFAAISFTSCGNKTSETPTDADSLTEVVAGSADSSDISSEDDEELEAAMEELASALESGDEEDITSTVEEANNKVVELLAEGKQEEAKAYAEAIKKFVMEHKDKFTATGSSVIASIVSNVEKLDVANLEETAKSLASSLNVTSEDAAAIESKAKETIENLKNTDAAEKAEAAANELKDNAKKAVEDAKAKTKEEVSKKVDEKVENAKEKAKEKINEGIGKLLGN